MKNSLKKFEKFKEFKPSSFRGGFAYYACYKPENPAGTLLVAISEEDVPSYQNSGYECGYMML